MDEKQTDLGLWSNEFLKSHLWLKLRGDFSGFLDDWPASFSL